MLAHPNHASKSPALLHYDKTVIGNSVIEAGEGDAGIIAPLSQLRSYVLDGTHPGWELSASDAHVGVALAADGNTRYGRIDPYWQGVNASVESMRNVAAAGATPRALTDCLNYGNPEIPEELWRLERGTKGIADACNNVKFDGEAVPVISGNVSLYNGSTIDAMAVVACVGVIADAGKAVDMRFKSAHSSIVLVGARKNECGGSAYYEILEEMTKAKRDSMLGANVPKPDFTEAARDMSVVIAAINEGKVLSCHDISDGGMLLALFEMTLPQRNVGGKIGAEIRLEAMGSDLRSDQILFSETGGFLIEATPENAAAIVHAAKKAGATAHIIGSTTDSPVLRISREAVTLLEENIMELRKTWETSLISKLKD